ncbi:MAG TPA: type I-B CRISPR-associated protein Cas8b1/Cst1 [Clostridia bacterium]
MSDWLYNAGLVGLVNILRYANDEVIINGQELILKANVFENFEDKYFKYFIETYGKVMIYSKLMGKIEYLSNVENSESKFEEINENIEYIKSKMKNSAYKNIADNMDFKKFEKVNKKNPEVNTLFVNELKETLLSMKESILKSECIGFYDQKAKASKAPNAIIDKYINTNMLQFDVLTQNIKNYLSKDKKSTLNCFSCGRPIEKIEKGLSFLNRMFFDTSRKTSHVWNFNSDIEVCPICNLIYYCIPAGFTTVYGNGIFINANRSIEASERINYTIKHDILKNEESKGIYNAFGTMIKAFNESINNSEMFEFADIQVVRLEDDKYKFNLLTKNIVEVLYKSKEELNSFIKCGFQEVKTYFKLYDEVMKKLLNNENLFLLIHKAIVIKISSPQDAKYNESHIKNLIKVNLRYMKGAGYMELPEKDIVKTASGAGYYLREAYKSKNSENKLNGISYRLLNALKTSNTGMFMDTVLNCYLYTGKAVPTFITECLKDDNIFKTIGYAFVTGMIDGKKNESIDGGKNNE